MKKIQQKNKFRIGATPKIEPVNPHTRPKVPSYRTRRKQRELDKERELDKAQRLEELRKRRFPKAPPQKTLEELEAGIGKSCAIIGNAQSIFYKAQGKYIDTFDVVVRINSAKIVIPQHQGSRTDIIFAHSGTVQHLPKEGERSFQVYNVSKDMPDLFEYWSNEVRKATGHDRARPTTGFLAITRMMQLGYQISLFGFDFYKTPTHYTNAGPLERHHPKWEEEVLIPMIKLHNEVIRNNLKK